MPPGHLPHPARARRPPLDHSILYWPVVACYVVAAGNLLLIAWEIPYLPAAVPWQLLSGLAALGVGGAAHYWWATG
jgi:hypothetical protein